MALPASWMWRHPRTPGRWAIPQGVLGHQGPVIVPTMNPLSRLPTRWAAATVLVVSLMAVPLVEARYAWESDTGLAQDELATVHGLLETGRYAEAVARLQETPLPGSADWNNLMGYSLRKMSSANLDRAEKFYQAALRIEPAHLGALAYYGELLLQRNDRDGARAMLARLRNACPAGCEPLVDLQRAMDAIAPKPGPYR